MVADGGSGIHIFDISNPRDPVLRGSLSTSNALAVTVDGNIAYLADYTGSLKVIDFSNPAMPQLLATTDPSLVGTLSDVTIVGNFVFGAEAFFFRGVPIVEVSNPSNPNVRTRLNFPGSNYGTGIAADNQFVYLTAGQNRLYIGQYLEIMDTGTIAPIVTMTSPTEGLHVMEGATLAITIMVWRIRTTKLDKISGFHGSYNNQGGVHDEKKGEKELRCQF